ncbi:hypothetical protein AB3A94_003924 [Vibrio alginolyticus]|uniref:DUF6701 domain-containing protein n=1 Tax=unclassified Vibrio TaxID=2614977 RepID=UPI002807A476|nr:MULTISPECIES: DUF6701 domain-containing protein [unclassified Vibrio]ELA6649317.1 hypothetical protein [Vibrio alginolyticus]MDW1797257.1 DUF6701 domain-containing protein [Vibrio sp. Vb2297]MDW1966727.1 DUF6701 domain-containing protein [Vibrio sp. Vb0587]MDW2007629.1 DUF6701 domain-containing protein [Vibrio sp. 431]
MNNKKSTLVALALATFFSSGVTALESYLPANVCQLFPEPIQGWKGSTSRLNITNDTAHATGWSSEYLADNANIYNYQQNWQGGANWDNLRVGFDEGGNSWQLYKKPAASSCNGYGCFPADGVSGDGVEVGKDGLVESRKAETPTNITPNFGSLSLDINPDKTDSWFFKKYKIEEFCEDNPSICRYESRWFRPKEAEVTVLSSLKSLTINNYGASFDKLTVVIADGVQVESVNISRGDNVIFQTLNNSTVTFGNWKEATGATVYFFGNNSRINIVNSFNMANKMKVANTNSVTLYAPTGDINFSTANDNFYGFVLGKTVSFENPITVHGAVTSQNLTMKHNVVIQKPDYSCAPPPPVQQCSLLPEENFNSGSLSNWSVMGFGTSDEPHISDGRFILNSNKPEQATASAYNYIFPSDQNYLEIEFDHNAYGGNGADGVALVISDASVPPQTGAFGGPLGYGMKLLKNHYPEVSKDVEGFAGGWLGIGIDEFGNYIREGSEKIVSNSVADNVGVRGQGVQDANGKWLKGYPYITGKKYSSSLDNRKGKEKLHRYKVVLNSRNTDTITLAVFRKVGKNGGWDPVIEEFNVLEKGGFHYIPDNFRLSVTASTGMLTNTHDIDNFRVCADKYSRLTDGIHHFEFDYSGSGSTCQASDVTLRACMNESCSEQYPRDAYDDGSLTPLSVTLLPSTGNNVANWVGGTNVQFENETQLELQGSRAGDITLGIDQSSVPQFGFEGARCRINGGPLSANNCNVTFASNVLAVNVNDVVASRETTGEDYLSFCSTRTEDGGESRGVNMSIDYEVAPIDSSQPVVISYKKKVKDQAVEWSSNVELTRANKYLPNVYFDDEGKAFFKLRYSEAGKVKLKASVEGVDDSDGFGSFVSFPSKLKVTAKSGDKSGECTNSENGCSSGFVAAGEVFELTISALQDDDTVAENYQEKTITVSNKVKYPSNGSLAKLLNEKLPESSKWSRGSVTFDQSVSEVGVFELIAEAPVAKDENGDDIGTSLYLGSNAFKIADGKSTIGRFYPDYFKVTGTEWTYPDNQNQSVYMGQNFESVKFEVTAYNANGYTTQNYGGFANSLKADLYLAGGYSDRLSILDSDLTSDNWSGAVWSKTWDNSVYWRKDLSLPSPDGPFNSKLPADKDSSIETSISLSLNNNGTKVSGYVDPTMFLKEGQNSTEDRMVSQQLLSQPDVRFGRIALDDVGVNQGKSVNIPLRVEYWRDTRFVLNSKDNGTTVSPTLKSQEPVWPDDGSDCDILLEGVRTTVNDGAMRELIAKQERADCGRQQAEVWLNLDPSGNNLPWLKYDWDNDGSEENPSSVVTFGIHRGNDRVIYRGEPGLTGQ